MAYNHVTNKIVLFGYENDISRNIPRVVQINDSGRFDMLFNGSGIGEYNFIQQ